MSNGLTRSLVWLLVGLLLTTSVEQSLAESLSAVDLPSVKPDEFKLPVSLVKLSPADAAGVKLKLLNPDRPHKGAIDRYELDPTATSPWNVTVKDKNGTQSTAGTITVNQDSLEFRWNTTLARPLLSGLRNCSLLVTTTAGAQRVHLRKPQIVEAATLDFRKDFLSFTIKGDDLPDENALLLELQGLVKAPATASMDKQPASFKDPTFVVLKPTEADVPGARLRVLLAKNGSQINALVRPELTPARADSMTTALPQFASINSAPAKSSNTKAPPKAKTPTTKPGVVTPGTPSANDPTASSKEPVILFTTKKLADSKTAINGQMNSCKQRIDFDNRAIQARQNELASIPAVIVGTADEIAATRQRIARIEGEINTLNREMQSLLKLIPEFEKQLLAFPPLESLGTQMQLTTQLSFRVYYLVDSVPVNLLVVGSGKVAQ